MTQYLFKLLDIYNSHLLLLGLNSILH